MKKLLTKIVALFCVLVTFASANKVEQTLKVHPFTGAIGSVSNILEFDDFLILVDPQETYKSEKALNSFIETLNKPLKGVILATHSISSDVYKNLPIYGTKATDKFVEDGKVGFFIDLFRERVGEDMILTAIRPTHFLSQGDNDINGVNFIVKTNDEGFPPEIEFEIEGQSILFTHIAANNSHYLIHSKDEVKPLIEKWKEIKEKGYSMILSSHLLPIDQLGVDFTIKYLETVQSVLEKDLSKEGFIAEMKAAYPDIELEEFLEMSAASLYK